MQKDIVFHTINNNKLYDYKELVTGLDNKIWIIIRLLWISNQISHHDVNNKTIIWMSYWQSLCKKWYITCIRTFWTITCKS